MACACKVNQDVSYLAKKYGTNMPVSKKLEITFNIKRIMTVLVTYMVLILAFPLFLVHILYVILFKKDKTIKIDRLIRLGNR